MELQKGLFKVSPPKLEDAGLEDCALPPEAIKQAFLKAASSVKSQAAAIFPGDEVAGDCVDDPGHSNGDHPDSLVGIFPGGEKGGSCIAKKGGLPKVYGDRVVDGDGGAGIREGSDRIDGGGVPESEGERACTEGLQGLEIDKKKEEGYESDEESEGEKPILTEAYV